MVNYLLLIFIFRLLFLVNKYTKLTPPAKLSHQQIKKKSLLRLFLILIFIPKIVLF